MKKITCILLAVLSVFTLVGCNNTAKEEEVVDEGPIVIAVDEAWTGANAGNGEWVQLPVQHAVDEINEAGGILGRQVEVIYEDSASTQNGAINAMKKIVENDDVLAVIGPHMSTDALAVSDTVDQYEIIYMTGGSSMALNDGNEWMFKLRCQDDIVASAAAEFATKDLGAKKVGIMYNNDEFGVGGRDILTAYFDSVGVEYVAEGHNSGESDFTSQILKMMNENVDTLILWTSGDISKIVKQRFEQGFEGNVITSSSFASEWTVMNMTTEECQGVYSATDMTPEDPSETMTALRAWAKDTFGCEPEAWISCYYNSVYILKDAIERAGSTDREAVKNALYETAGLDSVLGEINCDKNGALVHECVVTRVAEDKSFPLIKKITVE